MYTLVGELGKGSYGEVHKAVHTPSGRKVAVKRISHDKTEGVACTAMREVSLLSRLRHANIVSLLDCVPAQDGLMIVMELCDVDLLTCLGSNEWVPLQHTRPTMRHLMAGVSHMHSCGVLHRDLKPANLLLLRNQEGGGGGWTLKIGDLGLGRQLPFEPRPLSPTVCTRWYRPPEVILGHDQYGPELDLWSCGCILGEMATTRPVFPGRNELDVLDRIFRLLGTPPAQCEVKPLREWETKHRFPPRPADVGRIQSMFLFDSHAVDLFVQLTRYVGVRIPARDALVHPFLASPTTTGGAAKRPRSW